jgi:uncharacterized protein YsxB (DUF464 family)
MLKITYDRENTRVRLVGHADSAEAGHDLVCAAASMLTHTLAAFVRDIKGENAEIRLLRGDSLISCRVDEPYRDSAIEIFDRICHGFELLEESFPNCVEFEEI